MPRTKNEIEARLKDIENEVRAVRSDMQAISEKGRDVVNRAKGKRDSGLLSDIRKKLGI